MSAHVDINGRTLHFVSCFAPRPNHFIAHVSARESCKHSFSKAAIWDYLGNNESEFSRKPCPACNKMISKSEMHFNKMLEAMIKRQRRRQQADEDSDEAEEIIE